MTPANSRATTDAMPGDAPRVFTVAPSDLTFLLHECIRCFWLKIARASPRPQGPMPSVFTRMDRLQRQYFEGRSCADVSSTLPPGRITCNGLSVVSAPLTIPGATSQLRFRGALDAIVEFKTGGYGIVDFKTSSPSESSTISYQLQLQAYALAVENAAWPQEPLTPVTHLGLLCFDPQELIRVDGALLYAMNATWVPLRRDDAGFLKFLAHICSILERPKPPLAGANCKWCAWRDQRVVA